MKKTILIGITSGIAAFKSLELIELLQKEHIAVKVILTKSAEKMIDVKKLQKLCGTEIYSELFPNDFDYEDVLKKRLVEHINLADSANLMVIVPATANVIAKLANGIADDYVTTTALAITAPIIVCPAMNVHMWQNPLVQKNIHTLIENDIEIIEPTEGQLACGYEGKGRLEDIEEIFQKIMMHLKTSQLLIGKKIVLTAGGTQEPIDDVRFIANKSSGKMGIALAEVCATLGAQVTLIRARNSVSPRKHMKEVIFETSKELFDGVKKEVGNCDYFFHTAAVSDFVVENKQEGKISSDEKINLTLSPAPKILLQLKKLNSKMKLIGFKAESNISEEKLIEVSRKKLHESLADFIIANDVGKENQGFGSDFNEVFIVAKDSVTKIPHAKKTKIAMEIVNTIVLNSYK